MQTAHTLQIPERLRVLVTLAQLLERLEVGVRAGGADQYQSVVRHLVEELDRLEDHPALDAVLGMFPATSELYENLRYAQAGLCRTPLQRSLDSELQARAALARIAARRQAD